MDCPRCRKALSAPVLLSNGLTVIPCERCAGHWLRAESYWAWEETQPGRADPPAADAEADDDERPAEPVEAGLCPDCRTLLLRYPVGLDLDFSLDRCGHCGGVWLDAREWWCLESRGLSRRLYAIFTEPWQTGVRRARARAQQRRSLERRLGGERLTELERIRDWLAAQPERDVMIAYLLDPPASLVSDG